MKMEDIAKIAGVSKASVSRVVNNKANVSHALKEKIERIMREEGYTPNLLAQALNTKETKLIGVLIPSIGLDVFSDIVDGITEVIADQGYEIILADSKGQVEKSLDYLEVFKMKQVDGIIYFPVDLSKHHIDLINAIKIPTVMIGQAIDSIRHPSVSFDDKNVAFDVVHHLYEMGHRHITFMNMPKGHMIGNIREMGYLEAMETLSLKAEVFYADNLSYEAGYKCMEKTENSEATVIFGAMDRLVTGAMRYLHDIGRKVPNEMSFIGIDDMEVSKMLFPSLSSVALDYHQGGQYAGKMVIDMINHLEVNSISLEYEIKDRESMKEVQHVQ